MSNYCLFENHYYNNDKHIWVHTDDNRECLHSKCTRLHKNTKRPTSVCLRENDCPDANITCFLLHNNNKLRPLCHYGSKCTEVNCVSYRHPTSRTTEICPLGVECTGALIGCLKLHPLSKMSTTCYYKENCENWLCDKRHPTERKSICNDGPSCYNYAKYGLSSCNKIHPKIMNKICKWDRSENGYCKAFECQYLHHPDSPIDCIDGIKCKNIDCKNKHPLIYN